jgi:predicted ATP-grasp superfamily ATP-dependent carboligase
MTQALPAVVLGIDTPIGLTVIRDLGENGIPVIGIARQANALGMRSRFLERGLVRPATQDALLEQIVELGAELGQACLFAVSEGDIALLNRHRDRLGAYKLMFADERRMDSVLDKAQTYAAAARAGVRTPRTELPASMAEAEAVSAALRYPVVLKWANPHEAQRLLKPLGIVPDKMRYCHSASELLDYLRPFAPANTYPLIQEYCAGVGLGQFILMKDGQPHYTFQHLRVHEWPPEGGFSSMCESLPPELHRELMDKSVALLRELDWEGVAMVEYRHDPRTGESALMEINGRFWGSLPLAYHAGASFPTLCYRLFGLGEAVTQQPYRAGIRCRFMVPETKRLLRVLFQQGKIADRKLSFARVPELFGFLLDFVRPGSRYYVFTWRDPRPFFSDLAQMAGKALGRNRV